MTTDAEHRENIENLTYAMAALDGDRHQGRSHVAKVRAAIEGYEQVLAERDRLQADAAWS